MPNRAKMFFGIIPKPIKITNEKQIKLQLILHQSINS